MKNSINNQFSWQNLITQNFTYTKKTLNSHKQLNFQPCDWLRSGVRNKVRCVQEDWICFHCYSTQEHEHTHRKPHTQFFTKQLYASITVAGGNEKLSCTFFTQDFHVLQASRFTRSGANSLNLPLDPWPTSHTHKWAVRGWVYWGPDPSLSCFYCCVKTPGWGKYRTGTQFVQLLEIYSIKTF